MQDGEPPLVANIAGVNEIEMEEEAIEDRSLLEDLHALYNDGKTYASAELAFQKTRAGFAAGKLKSVVVFGAGAAVVALLAAIGLTVGAILSLETLIGPLGATAVVVIVLLIVAFLCARVAGKKWGELMSAFGSGTENRP
jgi:VIT1/CCC1 family predicted Fe2+/Mn2+ transporter